jgi:hypothetical protein
MVTRVIIIIRVFIKVITIITVVRFKKVISVIRMMRECDYYAIKMGEIIQQCSY